MKQLTWKEAIVKVLEEENRALHYTEIAELIAKRGYRSSFGATPQDTVSSLITTEINTKKEDSNFLRVEKGTYILLNAQGQTNALEDENKPKSQKNTVERFKVIQAFGIYWDRELVHWKNTPDLLGVQLQNSDPVNFKDQIGVYLLHDGRETIYVGQAIAQPLGQRLKDHTVDRLSGRWNRFSWFGFYGVNESSKLEVKSKLEQLGMQDLGDLLEAILIESIEPRQNRKQGNLFAGIEYLQRESPEIRKRQKAEFLKEITDKLM